MNYADDWKAIVKYLFNTFGLACALALAANSFAGPVLGQGTWETTLQARDINNDDVVDAYFDTDLNITWLADAGASGMLNWNFASDWARKLNVYGVTGWRLPSTTDLGSPGCNVSDGDCGPTAFASSSEMAHLDTITLGHTTNDESGPGGYNDGPFVGLIRSNYYWSGTDYWPAWSSGNYAWTYKFGDRGTQDYTWKLAENVYAFAVRDGDVLAVPEPSSYLLALAGLAVLAAVRRSFDKGRWRGKLSRG